jgi:hypothetical protein
MSAQLGTDDATHYTNQPTPPPTTALEQKLRPLYHELRNTPEGRRLGRFCRPRVAGGDRTAGENDPTAAWVVALGSNSSLGDGKDPRSESGAVSGSFSSRGSARLG